MPKLFAPGAHVVLIQAIVGGVAGRHRRVLFGRFSDALFSLERPAPVRLVLCRSRRRLSHSGTDWSYFITMKIIAIVLAIVFFVVGILYGLGKINLFTQSGPEHAHHVTHLIVLWFLALLCLDLGALPEPPTRY